MSRIRIGSTEAIVVGKAHEYILNKIKTCIHTLPTIKYIILTDTNAPPIIKRGKTNTIVVGKQWLNKISL